MCQYKAYGNSAFAFKPQLNWAVLMPPCSTEASENWGLLTPWQMCSIVSYCVQEKTFQFQLPFCLQSYLSQGQMSYEWMTPYLSGFMVYSKLPPILVELLPLPRAGDNTATPHMLGKERVVLPSRICNFVSLIKEKQWIQNSESKFYFFLGLRVLCCPGWSCGKSAHIRLK